ncbi:FtsX-like permease family protein [bacterium]|nr:FtsX-like permease family protein [bacterium]
MKKTFIKTIFRDFKKNFTRLIAIVAIMALGVGFLIGLLSSTPDLKNSMEKYYDDTNMFDIQLKSTIGFSKEDIAKLKLDIPEIEEIEGFSSLDYKTSYDNKEITTRMVTTSFLSKIGTMEVIQGRLPENDTECLVHNMGIFLDKDALGKSIKVEGKSYTIVGVCNSPYYYYKMQENTQVGNGDLDSILYVDETYTDAQITDIVITVQGAKYKNSFESEYFRFIEPIEDKIKALSNSYIEERMNSLYDIAIEEVRKTLESNPNIPSMMIDSILESQKETIIQTVKEQFSEPKWYVLDRKSNLSYITFEANANKVNNVAIVFPFFFFFIAALIALTSVTRLVHEDRSAIGTLKSLGYSNIRILNKYFIYAVFACIIGSIGGLFLGVYGLPMVIYYCYNSLFIMPTGHFGWYAWCVLLASISMSVIIFGVMIGVCLSVLRERPNALMVPKAPKAGRRILLERIGFIWKNLKFKYKSSIRNIFRFKKNLIMMIVGVGGCTALMIVGFGLRESLSSASTVQFEKIIKYDFSLEVNREVPFEFLEDSQTLYLYKEEGCVLKNKDYKVDILYTDDNIIEYMNLGVSKLPEDTVIISSQLAEVFHIRKNGYLQLEVDGEERTYKVYTNFENYIGNYVIMNQDHDTVNSMFLKLGQKDKDNYEDIVRKLYDLDDVLGVTDIVQTKELYSSLSNGMDLVIILVIFCSGLLAIIVIYNLTNININERIKEIATLKVLGYQKPEVLGYIYREIIMMSVLGILFGFGLGPLLNLFVMRQIASPGQSFSTTLGGLNFLYAFMVTFVFVGIVLLFFIPKMKKIKMVESLKSVE